MLKHVQSCFAAFRTGRVEFRWRLVPQDGLDSGLNGDNYFSEGTIFAHLKQSVNVKGYPNPAIKSPKENTVKCICL